MGAVVEPVEHLKELDYVDLFNAFAGPARIPPSKKAKKMLTLAFLMPVSC